MRSQHESCACEIDPKQKIKGVAYYRDDRVAHRRKGAKVRREVYFFVQRQVSLFFSGCVLVVQVFVLSVANRAIASVNNHNCYNTHSQLQLFTDKIDSKPRMVKVVQLWVGKPEQGFRADGFVPQQAIATTNIALDGLNSSVRSRATNLTALIALAMLGEVERADVAIFNAGAIRIDGYIPPGLITQYDIIRILPFGGKILAVEMKGSLLERVLEQGRANRGTGGYLQTANVSKKQITTWLIGGEPLDPSRNYRVAINDFLMSGKEKGLEFLNFNQKGVRLISQRRDIRLAVIEQLR